MAKLGRSYSKWRPISSRKFAGETIFPWRAHSSGHLCFNCIRKLDVQTRSHPLARRPELAYRLAARSAASEAYATAAAADHSRALHRPQTQTRRHGRAERGIAAGVAGRPIVAGSRQNHRGEDRLTD